MHSQACAFLQLILANIHQYLFYNPIVSILFQSNVLPYKCPSGNIKQNSSLSEHITVSYIPNINVGCKLKKIRRWGLNLNRKFLSSGLRISFLYLHKYTLNYLNKNQQLVNKKSERNNPFSNLYLGKYIGVRIRGCCIHFFCKNIINIGIRNEGSFSRFSTSPFRV